MNFRPLLLQEKVPEGRMRYRSGQGVSFFEILITAFLRQPPTVPIAIVMGVTRLPWYKQSDSETDREKVIGC